MRTTFDIPSELIDEIKRCTGARTRNAAVMMALHEYVQRRRAIEAFDALRGKVRFEEGALEDRNAHPVATSLLEIDS